MIRTRCFGASAGSRSMYQLGWFVGFGLLQQLGDLRFRRSHVELARRDQHELHADRILHLDLHAQVLGPGRLMLLGLVRVERGDGWRWRAGREIPRRQRGIVTAPLRSAGARGEIFPPCSPLPFPVSTVTLPPSGTGTRATSLPSLSRTTTQMTSKMTSIPPAPAAVSHLQSRHQSRRSMALQSRTTGAGTPSEARLRRAILRTGTGCERGNDCSICESVPTCGPAKSSVAS